MNDLILNAFFTLLVVSVQGKIKLKNSINVENVKEFKKVLKTHKNVLTVYTKDDKSVLNLMRWVDDVAKEIKGKGTIVYINCGESKDSKKLCKKYNMTPNPKLLKHYKDGVFHKDYDRKETAKSFLNFMLDPTGDAPWEEDPAAKNVVQIQTEKELIKLRRKEKGPMLIMFYAPWCGYCKKLKPDYAAAATELKGKAVFAGMDVDKPDAFNVRYQFNITGFPTLIYFENGEQKYRYGGKLDKQGLIDWIADPQPEEETKEEELPWSAQAPEISHLTDANFDESLKEHPSIIVMFYAPWCGHCKAMKPEFVEAAKQMKEEEISGTLAAVDCTKEQSTCKKFDVSGYPTVKYFQNGEYKFKLSVRQKDKIIEFMKNPEAPPPPPPEDQPWPDVSGPEVLHLEDNTFKDDLKKKKHVLVMFYAPWCGHCKKAKPEIQTAAEHYKDDRKIWFAGVDCTTQKFFCEQFDVTGYPTFRYFLYGKKDFAYNGGRTSDAFIEFMKDPSDKPVNSEPVEPEWKDTPSGVVHLDDDFEEFVKTHPSVFVMFYAPWCGHCKAMKPAFTEAANELLNKDHVLAAVDCTKHRRVASKYDIKGYPTLKYFKDGTDAEYEGGRSKDDIVNFLTSGGSTEKPKKPIESGWADENQDVTHLDEFTFNDFMKENPSVLVMFYAPWCGHCKRMKPAYGEAARLINTEKQVAGKLAAVDCIVNEGVCRDYGVRGYPTLKYFKNGVKELDYDGGRATEDLVNFMKDPKPAPPKPIEKTWSEENTDVAHLTEDTFDNFVGEHHSVLVMFYAPWCGHCKRMKPVFAEAAMAVNSGNEVAGKLAAVDCTANQQIANKYEIKGYPTLKYFKNGKEEFKYQGGRTKDALVEFMENPSTQTRPPVTEWKDEPSDVVHLSEDTFDEDIKDKEILVMFYAPWCGHCNSMKPVYMETAKQLKADNFPGLLAAIDATQNRAISKREGVTGYPTLRYYSNGGFVDSFEDMRTVDNLEKFMKNMLESANRKISSFDGDKWEDIPSSVVHLQRDNFQSHINQVPNVLVMFHVKWCKGCLEIRNELIKTASRLSNSASYSVAAVSCGEDGEHCHEHDVTSFPALKYYSNGKFSENYSGAMKSADFVSYLHSKQKEEL